MSIHPIRDLGPDLPRRDPRARPVSPAALPAITVTAHQVRGPQVSPVTDPGEDKAMTMGPLGAVVGVALAAVIVAPITLSASHLIKWASASNGLGLPTSLSWLVFVALDLAAVVCIGMTIICAKRGEGAAGFSIATWAFALGSAFSNFSGAAGAGKWFFPAMSLAGPALLEMVLSKVKGWARVSDGSKLSARPRFGVRWLPGIAMQETGRAWAAARRENITKSADAIAFVREMDLLKEMHDADAVRYAQAALRTADPHELRQWLTSRNKNVAQAALPTIALPAMTVEQIADGDIAREGAPLPLAPFPEKLRAPREALGLPAAPEPVTEAPKPRPLPRPVKDKPAELPARKAKGDPTTNPRWNKGVAAYRESVEAGNPMSQRELADHMKMANRTLAAQIIKHVRDERKEG